MNPKQKLQKNLLKITFSKIAQYLNMYQNRPSKIVQCIFKNCEYRVWLPH